MRKLFTLLIAITAALGLTLGGVAFADGPSGSSEHETDPETGEEVFTNDVQCDGGEATPAGHVYAAEDGVEVCNDGQGGEVTPVQGRIIVDFNEGYVAADGDQDNVFEGDDTLTGYVRIDETGVHCSSEEDTSAPHSGTPGDGSTCG